jgi:holo-ACP synthase/triphosphoribosyl-dephospho-CoA synthase
VKHEEAGIFFAGSVAAGLEDVLAEREDRVRRQDELRRQFGSPLVCLTLNIPGPYKTFPWARRCFFEGMKTLARGLSAGGIGIRHEESSGGKAGYRGFIAAGGGARELKAIAIHLEETHPLGRLFDIDVLGEEGKIPRSVLGAAERTCLVCGDQAFVCGRNRAHGVEELTGAVLKIMENFFRHRLGDTISGAALGALMGEVAVTPKPGLVDRANNGAHRDMNFFSFIDSTAAIIPYFKYCALAGFKSAPAPEEPEMSPGPEIPGLSRPPETRRDPAELFNSLRFEGKLAELAMREAAGGANTHRGIIFSLGVLSAAYGRLFRHHENPALAEVLDLCRLMTVRLHEDFSRAGAGTPSASGHAALSHGETLYMRHGLQGIRGEVSRGFPTVRDIAWPALCDLLDRGYSWNDAGISVFLRLLSRTEDTNIVHRSSPGALGEIQEKISAFLAADPAVEEIREKAAELDREFINRRISPGGSADLLAVTFFLYRLLQR